MWCGPKCDYFERDTREYNKNNYNIRDFNFKNKRNSVSIKYNEKTTRLKVELVSKKWILVPKIIGRGLRKKEKITRNVYEITLKDLKTNNDNSYEYDKQVSDIDYLAVKMILRKENIPQVTAMLESLEKGENIQLRLDRYLKENKLEMVEVLYFFVCEVRKDFKHLYKPYFKRLIDKYLEKKMPVQAFRIARKEYGTISAFVKISKKYNDKNAFEKIFKDLKKENRIKIIKYYTEKNKPEIAEKLFFKSELNVYENRNLLKEIINKYLELGKLEIAKDLYEKENIEDKDLLKEIINKYLELGELEIAEDLYEKANIEDKDLLKEIINKYLELEKPEIAEELFLKNELDVCENTYLVHKIMRKYKEQKKMDEALCLDEWLEGELALLGPLESL